VSDVEVVHMAVFADTPEIRIDVYNPVFSKGRVACDHPRCVSYATMQIRAPHYYDGTWRSACEAHLGWGVRETLVAIRIIKREEEKIHATPD
jgi:hypothetical protein